MKPHQSQLNAVTAAIKYEQCGLIMPTGSGKSFVARLIAEHFNLKTLVVVPNLGIKAQMIGTFKDMRNVIVENVDSPRLKTLTDFDVLILDEMHHAASKTYRKLNKFSWNKIYYRFFLSATGFRNDPEEALLLESICGQIKYQLSYNEAVANNYIVPVDSFYYQVPKQICMASTYREVYNDLIINNDKRNLMIVEILSRLSGVSTLCLVKEIVHGKILSEITGIPFVYGEDETTKDFIRQFNTGTIKQIIGTTGVIGEGIDTKPCEYVIIAGLGKAKSGFMQNVGRAVRNYPGKSSAKVIIFKDSSHRFTLRHFNEQKTVLVDEYGSNPIKLNI